jgi:hypothetical protein
MICWEEEFVGLVRPLADEETLPFVQLVRISTTSVVVGTVYPREIPYPCGLRFSRASNTVAHSNHGAFQPVHLATNRTVPIIIALLGGS